MFFVFLSMVLRVREWIGERVEAFFILHTNEDICAHSCGLLYFTQIPLCMHFITTSGRHKRVSAFFIFIIITHVTPLSNKPKIHP